MKNKIIKLALKLDKDLIRLLLSDKNPPKGWAGIGLTLENSYLSEKKEVVLSWPYKDCVLEGEVTKEDQKREKFLPISLSFP